MEVHHHAHLASGGTHTKRKKWTHYFWEFLMLFLAVFCGFLAEYQLEHTIEKDRARQYLRSFYADLENDTASVSASIAAFNAKLSALGNCRECYDSLMMKNYSGGCIANLVLHSVGFRDFIQSDQTLQQLKNAGGLRLLKKQDADSILLYDKQVRSYILFETTGFQQRQNELRLVMDQLINYEEGRLSPGESMKPLFYMDDKKLINRYFNVLNSYAIYCMLLTNNLIQLKQEATGLLTYFKNKYHYNE
jgi:hypothetical protein